MKSYLSGMPECKFGMNDKIAIETQMGKKGGNVDMPDTAPKRFSSALIPIFLDLILSVH